MYSLSIPRFMWLVAITASVVLLHLNWFSVVSLSFSQIVAPMALAWLIHVIVVFSLIVVVRVLDTENVSPLPSKKRYPNRGNVSGDDSLY